MAIEKDVEKSYSSKGVVAKLRRMADALEQGRTFEIQVAGERVRVPRTRPSSSSTSAKATTKSLRSN